jgi:two-component system, OmpR family, sensor histidine kinase VicK
MNNGRENGLPAGFFQTVFEKSPGSILVKADPPHFSIVAVSDIYLDVTSSKREDIVEKGFFEVFPEDNARFYGETNARHLFTKVIATGKKVDVPSYRFDVYNAETRVYDIHYWSCLNTPILDSNDAVAYILNTIVDITAEAKAKEAAIEKENRLRLATEATALATWDLILDDQTFLYSPRLAEIFGHPVGTPITLAHIRAQVEPDDLKNIVEKAYYESMVTGQYLYEVRIYWPDESLHWIKTQGIVLRDEKGRPERMIGTILDITENKRDEMRKNDFIAMASHELKTPLTSIKAYIQLVQQKIASLNDAFVDSALAKANHQVNKMTSLVHGFLDLSKREPGKIQLKLTNFDIYQLLVDCAAEFSSTSHGHTFEVMTGESIMVRADKEKIEEVVSNFLSNAVKYSQRDTKITLAAKIVDDNVQVSVTDKGIGIKPKDQEKLFQRFYRVENERIKNVSGFGIGLYLASEIIQRHKGKIWVESDEGKGSTFYFSLPLLA